MTLECSSLDMNPCISFQAIFAEEETWLVMLIAFILFTLNNGLFEYLISGPVAAMIWGEC